MAQTTRLPDAEPEAEEAPEEATTLERAADLILKLESILAAKDLHHEAERATTVDRLAKLRESFPASQVGLLPRAYGPKDRRQTAMCNECGKRHEMPAVHLDYVGHGAVTARLLDVDPFWQWEPKGGWDESGQPVFIRDRQGNPVELWIDLTICGITRPGVGTVEAGKTDPQKQLIGDAIRNAAMRFGVALDLWIKGHGDDDDGNEDGPRPPAAPQAPQDAPPEAPPTFNGTDEDGALTLGWESLAVLAEAHIAFKRAAKEEVSEGGAEALAAVREQEGYGWPMKPDELEDMWRRLEERKQREAEIAAEFAAAMEEPTAAVVERADAAVAEAEEQADVAEAAAEGYGS